MSDVDALGNQTTFTYGPFDELTSATDPAGVTTTLDYDANANLLLVSRPLTGTTNVKTTTIGYGDTARPGDITSVTDPTARVSTFAYDAAGNVTSATDSGGNVTTFGYDTIGRRTSTVSPRGNVTGADPARHTTTFTYDGLGDLTSMTDPTGAVTSRVLDGNRNLTSLTDPDAKVTSFTYDANDRLTVESRPDATTLGFGYDANDNLTSQTNAANHTTSYTYDALDRVVAMVDPLLRSTTFGYDGAGNRVRVTDAAGQTTTFSYDDADRPVGTTYSDGTTPAVTTAYDTLGRRTSMTDGTGTSTYTWDSLQRLTSTTDGAGAIVSYGYDLAGRVTAITYPNGSTIIRDYDPAGRFASVTDWSDRTTSFDYDPDGNLTGEALGNGTTATYSLDDAGRLTGIDHAGLAGSLATFDYTRTDKGLLASATTTGISQPDEVYAYTPLDQLAAVNAGTYDYDTADNLTKLVSGATLAHDAANQITSLSGPEGTTTFTHDARGNRTQTAPPDANPTAYGYDQANRLTQVATTGSSQGWVTGGGFHSAAVKTDGTVVAWGSNFLRQLGNGAKQDSATPVPVSDLTGVDTVAGGDSHTLALKADGTVWAWGSNSSGQIGDGTTRDPRTPVQVIGLTGVTAIAAGGAHSLALKADGTLWAWGSNVRGQLGDGTTTNRTAPVQVNGITGVTAFAGGHAHTLALKADGTVWAWGNNASGQLGDGTTTSRSVPAQVNGLTGATSIAATVEASHSAALKADGTVWAWGSNNRGQLGDGTTTNRTRPVQVTGLTGVTSIVASGEEGAQFGGLSHTLALKGDGTVWAWGYNNYGQLGDGTTTDRTQPVQVTGLTQVAALSGGGFHNLALKIDGSVWAWGDNRNGQLGDGTTINRTTPVQVSGLQTHVSTPTTQASYAYNGDGLRTTKTVAGATNRFTWDSVGTLPLLLSDGTNSYIYGPHGLPIQQVATDGTTLWFHHDQIGSTRLLTDSTGAIAATHTYDAYGNQTAKTGSASTPLGYTGEYADGETGFVYLRARYYDPATGLFVSRDSLAALSGDPYAYVSNNPHNMVDPSGLCKVGPVRIGILSNANEGCRGAATARKYADDVGVVAGVASGLAYVSCPFTAGAGCVVGAGLGIASAGAAGVHAAAQCVDWDAYCWRALGNTALSTAGIVLPALEVKAVVQSMGLGVRGQRIAQAFFNFAGWDAAVIPAAFRVLDTTQRPEPC